MLNKVADFIDRHQLLSRDGLHIVALSGGADSVALLLVLRHLGYHVEAAHCNFQLRGEESNRDERFVKELCEKHEIPLHLIRFETREYALQHQVSIEMAARELRYRYFAQLRDELGAETVCVAHHRDDSVETLLMNLIRGTGIHGLTGIRPLNGHVVRPFLCISREETENYLRSIGQAWVTDSTNLEDEAVRNKIRLNVLPLLREINPNVAESIERTAKNIEEAEKIFNNTIESEISSLLKPMKSKVFTNLTFFTLPVSELLSSPSPMSLLHEVLSRYGFKGAQTVQILACAEKGQCGREFLSPTHIVVTDRDRIIISPALEPMKPLKVSEVGTYYYTNGASFQFSFQDSLIVSKSDDLITIDAEKVLFPLSVRPVREGDRFRPFGMKGQKLVSDYLTDRKLNLLEKRLQLVVTDAEDSIIWLVGHRIDDRFRVTETTKKVLAISFGL